MNVFHLIFKKIHADSSDFYENVYLELELAFSKYESGAISIHTYEQTVRVLQSTCMARRSPIFRLSDWSIVLRPLIRAERATYREAIEAFVWCLEWARRQRGDDITACLKATEPCTDPSLAGYQGVPA